MLDVKQLDLQYITNPDGEKTAVVVPIQQFQQLLEEIEGLTAVANQRHEPMASQTKVGQTGRRYSFIGVGQTSDPKASVDAEGILEREADTHQGWSLKSLVF
ncbi:MAG: hypothetical protein KIT87_22600 [Anaerolineae bacterium]|nr:hypothetical protein [Anaerolineae bacterium]